MLPQEKEGHLRVMSERLEIRITEPKKKLLKDAADLLGVTVTRFILRICTSEAKKIISKQGMIVECDNRQLDMFHANQDK